MANVMMVVEEVIRIIRKRSPCNFEKILYADLYQKLRFTSFFEDLNS